MIKLDKTEGDSRSKAEGRTCAVEAARRGFSANSRRCSQIASVFIRKFTDDQAAPALFRPYFLGRRSDAY
jgi:hypothetical protein